jgi:hypothetical protein
MDRFPAARAAGQELAPTERSEFEELVDAEWQAAVGRAGAILKNTESAEW